MVGGVAGGVTFVILAVAIGAFLFIRKRKKKTAAQELSSDPIPRHTMFPRDGERPSACNVTQNRSPHELGNPEPHELEARTAKGRQHKQTWSSLLEERICYEMDGRT